MNNIFESGFNSLVSSNSSLLIQQLAKSVQEGLSNSDEQLEVILQGVADGIVVMDSMGQFIYANDAAAKMSGYQSAQEYLGKTSHEIVQSFQILDEKGQPFLPGNLPGSLALRGVKEPPPVVVQFYIEGKKQARWSMVSARPIFDSKGQVQMVVSIFKDFTERRNHELQIEQYLREMAFERAQLRTVISQLSAGVIIVEAPSGRAILLNEKVNQIWKQSSIPMDGSQRYQFLNGFHIDGRPYGAEDWPSYRSVRFGEVVKEEEIKILRGDGSFGHVLVSSDPIFDNEGQITAAAVTIQDITEMRRQTDAAKFLDEATRLLSSSLDYKRTLETVGQLAIQSLGGWIGVSLKNEKGMLDRIVVAHNDPNKVQIVHQLKELYPENPDSSEYQVLRTGQPQFVSSISDEMIVASARDDRHLALIRELGLRAYIAVPLTSKDGVMGVLAFASVDRDYDDCDLTLAKDLADRASMAIENSRLFKKSQEASQAKTNFLANMSHELRTPLGAVLGYSELLLGPEPLSEKIEYVMAMRRNGDQLLRLIDDLLDLSKVEAGHLHFEEQEFSLSELLKDFSSLFKIRAKEKGIHFELQIATSLPDRIVSDSVRLRQVLTNIIGNAVKFTTQGKVTARVSFQSDGKDQSRGRLHFEIIDTGVGLSEEQSKSLFQSFVQADSSTTRRFGGTGLGLALSRRLARAMNGDVVLAKSELGKGSTFVIDLEARVAGESSFVTSERFESRRAQAQKGEISLDGAKVLLVEDSPDNRTLLWNYLSREGAIVDTANDGFEGILKATSQAYDVILMDIQMPHLGGHEAIERLRSAGYQIPIIAITAHAMEEDRARCFAAGCSEYLAKPINRQELLRTVSRFANSSPE